MSRASSFPSQHWIDIEKPSSTTITVACHFDPGTDEQFDRLRSDFQQHYWMILMMKQLYLLTKLIDQAKHLHAQCELKQSEEFVFIDGNDRVCCCIGSIVLAVDIAQQRFEIMASDAYENITAMHNFYESLHKRKLCYSVVQNLQLLSLRDTKRSRNGMALSEVELQQRATIRQAAGNNYLNPNFTTETATNVLSADYHRRHRISFEGVKTYQDDTQYQQQQTEDDIQKYFEKRRSIDELRKEIATDFEKKQSDCVLQQQSCSLQQGAMKQRQERIRFNFILWLVLRYRLKKLLGQQSQIELTKEAFDLFKTQLVENDYDFDRTCNVTNSELQQSFWAGVRIQHLQHVHDNADKIRQATLESIELQRRLLACKA